MPQLLSYAMNVSRTGLHHEVMDMQEGACKKATAQIGYPPIVFTNSVMYFFSHFCPTVLRKYQNFHAVQSKE